jgi:flagellar biosynthesis chaperone FliJ
MARMESLKVDSIELTIRKAEIIDLKNINTSQVTTIANLRTEVLTCEARVSNYQSQVQVLEKDLKKQKRKTKIAAISGLVLTGLTAFLLITK